MTTTAHAWAVPGFAQPLVATDIERRELRPDDIRIDIEYCGVCHSDIHVATGDWGERRYPLVPGHEIIGRVSEVGSAVTDFRVGERAGVGCIIDSCGHCHCCGQGAENYCLTGPIKTYGEDNRYADGEYTQGGYSTSIVVKDSFGLHVCESVDPAATAPLLCAGITTYSPLKNWGAGPGTKVAVIGMGGLGHVAVKIAAAMGCEVTVFSRGDSKKSDALAFGAKDLIATGTGNFAEDHRGSFDIILNTVSADLDLDTYMQCLRLDGVLVQLGLPMKRMGAMPRTFTQFRRSLAGSFIGGISETQEMLDFCAEHGVGAEVEIIDAAGINEAFTRTLASKVRYRFVIDCSTI
ncbi:NAD(P)-dependent alcohol dehydrogenase [Corynebacterium pacaense]|uniref:NAD(P)-dependent alcohol dehydrogenase n=1 Tax=Corynebacterium pacaense TaxID=1816684 RepID=UPI0009B9EAAD|nr:NAD(P)-dependent alcohol dehydrogenase [Corynebacterium pacaense]